VPIAIRKRINRLQLPGLLIVLLLAQGPALASDPVLSSDKVDYVLVSKSKARLYLVSNGKVIRSLPVAFGRNPYGHKEKRGDQRTPEGRYQLDYKNEDSEFYKSIHISYPNDQDERIARSKGLDPGDMIMIHGQKNGYAQYARFTQRENWTDGCIALTNEDMDIVWSAVEVPIPIEIVP